MTEKLYVSPSPHLRQGDSTRGIMLDVLIALIPAVVASVVLFGFRSLLIIGVSMFSAVLSEYICRRIMKRNNTAYDLSAAVTGLLVGLNMPVSINPLIPAFGSVIAIVVVKQMFGGLGQNFVNPALAARIILMISFPTQMTRWTYAFGYIRTLDGLTTATPLADPSGLRNILDLVVGKCAGCLGETCGAALIIGGLYLIARRVITPTIPLAYIGTVFVLTAVLGQNPFFHIFAGGLMLGAIFMATDYVTCPMTFWGKIIYGIGCGLLTVLIRLYGSMPEGVSFSILLMNILVPHIEKLTMPKFFGKGKKAR